MTSPPEDAGGPGINRAADTRGDAAPSAEQGGPASLNPPDGSSAPLSSLESWVRFDLNGRRANLDEEGLLIAKRQDASAQSRKDLSVSTRNFKRNKLPSGNASSEQVAAASKAFTVLLKQYQSEVDALTTRAKASEAAFLSTYKALYEVPDPVADLKHGATDRATCVQLRDEMRALRAEHSGLAERSAAAQEYEARIERLEAENKMLASKTSDEVKTAIEEKQSQWMSAQQKAIEAYELREQELLHQLSVANDAMREQNAGAEALRHQRDEAIAQRDELKKARVDGAEMMVEDGKRARNEVNDLRRRCAQLETQISVLSGEIGEDGDGGPIDPRSPEAKSGRPARGALVGLTALSAEIAAREVEVSQLKDQVVALEEVLSGQDAEKSTEFARLSASIKAKDDKIAKLANDLDALPTVGEYETMKRQLEAFQSFQLNDEVGGDDIMSTLSSSAGADASSVGAPESGNGRLTVQSSADLEKRLLGKLKSMESKAAAMRVELGGKSSRIEELSSMVRSLEERNDDHKALIAKLEDGINAMTGDPSSAKGLMARFAGESNSNLEAIVGGVTPSSSSGADGLSKTGVVNASGIHGASAEDAGTWDWGEQQQAAGLQKIINEEPTMLDIVAGQRDRFRGRTHELETENRKISERLERATTEVDSLKTDNCRLYEKIRYLQSYTQNAAQRGGGASGRIAGSGNLISGAGSSSPAGSGSVAIGMDEEEGSTGFLNQYRSMYEEMVNPYTLFNRRERHKRISEMSAPERLTLRATQRAVSTKTSRLFVFSYMLCLHLLVFAVLGFASSSSSCPDVDVTTKARHS